MPLNRNCLFNVICQIWYQVNTNEFLDQQFDFTFEFVFFNHKSVIKSRKIPVLRLAIWHSLHTWKLILIMYSLVRTITPNVATIKQMVHRWKVSFTLSMQPLYKIHVIKLSSNIWYWVTTHGTNITLRHWTCDLNINKDHLLSRSNHCTNFVNSQAKGSKDS